MWNHRVIDHSDSLYQDPKTQASHLLNQTLNENGQGHPWMMIVPFFVLSPARCMSLASCNHRNGHHNQLKGYKTNIPSPPTQTFDVASTYNDPLCHCIACTAEGLREPTFFYSRLERLICICDGKFLVRQDVGQHSFQLHG